MTATKAKKMNQTDYMRICAEEVLTARGDERTPPRFCWELYQGFEQDIQDRVDGMVDEMFGVTSFGRFTTGTNSLSMKESRIAERTDIGHAVKMGLVQEIRTFLKLKAQVKEARAQNVSAPSFTSLMTDDGRAWAQELGIRLD